MSPLRGRKYAVLRPAGGATGAVVLSEQAATASSAATNAGAEKRKRGIGILVWWVTGNETADARKRARRQIV
jgi:hypothetical protein